MMVFISIISPHYLSWQIPFEKLKSKKIRERIEKTQNLSCNRMMTHRLCCNWHDVHTFFIEQHPLIYCHMRVLKLRRKRKSYKFRWSLLMYCRFERILRSLNRKFLQKTIRQHLLYTVSRGCFRRWKLKKLEKVLCIFTFSETRE